MKTIWYAIAAAALVLAADKVKNEHAMTTAYERWAVAAERQTFELRRIANSLDLAAPKSKWKPVYWDNK